jgi:hypothetical protein
MPGDDLRIPVADHPDLPRQDCGTSLAIEFGDFKWAG